MVYTKIKIAAVLATLVCVHGTSPPTVLVTETCSKTEKPDICVSTLGSDPRSAEAKDASALARIGIQVLGTKYNETLTHADNLLQDRNKTYEQWMYRSPCWHAYNAGKDVVELDVLRMFDDNNFSGAILSLNQVRSAPEECNGYKVPELKEANNFLIGLAQDMIAILRSLSPQPAALRGLKQIL